MAAKEGLAINEVRTLIAKQLGVDVKYVTNEAHFAYDLRAHWLDRLELMIVIEDRFDGVEITDDDFDEIKVVGDLIRHIESVGAMSPHEEGLPNRGFRRHRRDMRTRNRVQRNA
jgi:acyl carrier protein